MNNLDQILKDQFKKLPEKLQAIISTPVWRNGLQEKAKKFGLNENQVSILENEVIFVLMGLEPKENFGQNIEREVELEKSLAIELNNYVNGSIFSGVTRELQTLWTEPETNYTPISTPKPEQARPRVAPVGFEEAILNQAKAMRPAVAPDNLPIQNPKQNNEPSKVHNYSPGADPYREPTE